MQKLKLKSNSLQWIESGGGPLLVVTMEDSGKWQGNSNSHYEEACKFENEIEKITVKGDSFILLGEEAYPTTFFESGDGGCLLRWVYGDSDDGLLELMRKSTHRLNREKADILLTTGPSGIVLLFDSAATKEQASDQFLKIPLLANANYGMNWEYLDLSNSYRVMICSIYTLPQ